MLFQFLVEVLIQRRICNSFLAYFHALLLKLSNNAYLFDLSVFLNSPMDNRKRKKYNTRSLRVSFSYTSHIYHYTKLWGRVGFTVQHQHAMWEGALTHPLPSVSHLARWASSNSVLHVARPRDGDRVEPRCGCPNTLVFKDKDEYNKNYKIHPHRYPHRQIEHTFACQRLRYKYNKFAMLFVGNFNFFHLSKFPPLQFQSTVDKKSSEQERK